MLSFSIVPRPIATIYNLQVILKMKILTLFTIFKYSSYLMIQPLHKNCDIKESSIF